MDEAELEYDSECGRFRDRPSLPRPRNLEAELLHGERARNRTSEKERRGPKTLVFRTEHNGRARGLRRAGKRARAATSRRRRFFVKFF